MNVLMFPGRESLYRIETARRVARRTGWDVRNTVRWMIEQGCSQDALNLLSELGRELRMQQSIGEMK